ncbi:hypothetical protein SAMN05421788_108236 [Filimonas lacunae]|uniref:Uncharacterized protein n=1 Tax=Filimonas lacunae TaxID=477680 RepID=A0A173MDR2_9BACT|nr:hypothetical protein [Filimonas lacunae]BAV05619.1 hypothetical protein FLA_1630 [Filimonas lacunae]SIT29173.1 hypothetical protein SAMN05421788_108236 [Filimonas lacunae]
MNKAGKKELIEYAKTLGINLTVDPALDKSLRKTLFPEKIAEAKRVLSKMKSLPK